MPDDVAEPSPHDDWVHRVFGATVAEATQSALPQSPPDQPEPDQPAPDLPTPNQPEPDQPAPDQPKPDQPAPNQPEPDQPAPDQPDPDQPAPDQPEPDQPAPDQPDPDEPAPDQPEPDQPAPDQPDPDQPVETIYVIDFNGKQYWGTENDLASIRSVMRTVVRQDTYDPLKNKAEYHTGFYDSQRTLNNGSIVGWVVRHVGGADLDGFGAACAAQDGPLAALLAAIDADPGSASTAFKAAIDAVNAAGAALQSYMTSLESGTARTILPLQYVEVGCFAVAAACGAAVLAPAGSSTIAILGANTASGAGFGALEEVSKQFGAKFIAGQNVSLAGAMKQIAVSAGINGLTGFLSSGAGKLFKGQVVEEIIKRANVTSAAEKELVEAYVEAKIGGIANGLMNASWGKITDGTMTWAEFAVVVGANIAGATKGGVAAWALPVR